MDGLSPLAAALDAGKLPSQAQINGSINWLLKSPVIQLEAQSADLEGKLSEYGLRLAKDVRGILEAYQVFGKNKNGDDIVQDALWNLSQGELAGGVAAEIAKQPKDTPAANDAQRLSSAIRTLIHIFLGNVHGEGGSLFADLASFLRLFLADRAEDVEERARVTKETLRQTEDEVQEGKRDPLGRTGDVRQDDLDTRAKFERNMNTAKEVGSKTIGVHQSTKAAVQRHGDAATNALVGALENAVKRAQNDPQYHEALSTIFDLTRRWYSKTVDTAKSDLLETFVDDPTGRIPSSIRQIRTFLERLAGGKSLNDLLAAVRRCANDIHNDPELHKFVDDYLSYVQHSLDDVEFRRKWVNDLNGVKAELNEIGDRIRADQDVRKLVEAHARLGRDLAEAQTDVTTSSLTQASWIWQDILNVYLPRVFGLLKDIPIPRTEYTSPEVDFVLENLNIESARILPGHAHIKTTAEADITQDVPGQEARTSASAQTTIQLQGVQLHLREVSFYHEQKEHSAIAPNKFTGLVDVTLPPRGVDAEISLSMLPTTDTAGRERHGGFFKIERVTLNLSDDMDIKPHKTNHSLLVGAFKGTIKKRVRKALEGALRDQLEFALTFLDRTAYDIHKRAKVFLDTGLSPAAAYAGATVSEIGHLRSLPGPGPLTGWRATGTGVVKDDPRSDKAFAMGAEPQIISGDKRGPAGTFSGPLACFPGWNCLCIFPLRRNIALCKCSRGVDSTASDSFEFASCSLHEVTCIHRTSTSELDVQRVIAPALVTSLAQLATT
uniref:Uncharacterized protein n=1 Tax=Schizophyllum commune (strain H4-8 / FGSC 9210) TaxID=578458 RepID=D8Q4R6_SCHCM